MTKILAYLLDGQFMGDIKLSYIQKDEEHNNINIPLYNVYETSV